MRNYQLVLVLKSSLSDANRKKTVEEVKDFLSQGKVSKSEDLGEKNLAYPISRETKGFYYNFLFEVDDITGIDKRILGNEDILRHLLIRV
ncbi:MAG: 30S ribosomal protein S6 [Candidatus Levybacteria bacterium]|nr:30S ribosomal protein S6 [Candidatus Levybacteria bacterium]